MLSVLEKQCYPCVEVITCAAASFSLHDFIHSEKSTVVGTYPGDKDKALRSH